jgi:hypothetical protein
MARESSPPSRPYKIHAVAFTEGPWCVAQCLEYDIATQARSMSALYHEIERIIAAHILLAQQQGREPFANIPRAPKRFWRMYKDANLSLEPVRPIEFVSQPPVEVELRAA